MFFLALRTNLVTMMWVMFETFVVFGLGTVIGVRVEEDFH